MRRIGVVALLLCARIYASGVVNTPCPLSGTLDQLIALNNAPLPGCSIDGLNYANFAWVQGPNSSITLASNLVNFTTSVGNLTGTLDITSPDFFVDGSDT